MSKKLEYIPRCLFVRESDVVTGTNSNANIRLNYFGLRSQHKC